MECHVCGETDTSDDWCKCIICDECGTKTNDEKIVFHEKREGMYCSAKCAKGVSDGIHGYEAQQGRP